MTGPGILAVFVDLVVVCICIVLLVYVLAAGVLKTPQTLPKSGVIIAIGIILGVVAHVSDLTFNYLLAETGEVAHLGSSFFSASWFHWTLSRIAFALISVGLLILVLGRRRRNMETVHQNALLEDLRSSRDVSDRRFRYLFDSTTDSVYCYRFPRPISIYQSVDTHIAEALNAELHRANDVFVRDLEASDVSEVIGRRFGELESAKDSDAHRALITAFVENGYRLENYELGYKTPLGEDRALCVNLIGVVQKGCLERIWGVESNVLEFRETKAELAHRQRYQKLVADVSTRLVAAPDDQADAAISDCVGRIAEFFGADRATMYWGDDADKQSVSITCAWSRDGVDPFAGTITPDQFPVLWQQVAERRELVRIDSIADLSDEFAADREASLKLGVKSLLVLPLVVGDEIVGGMTLVRVRDEKPWSDQMLADITIFSEVLASSMLRLKSRRELAEALHSLRSATDRLEAENIYLREEVERKQGFDEIIGECPAILRCLNQVEQVADTQTPVLIMGETGTGKELIARAIHEHSSRRDRPLVKVNCAALPANLIESELFGHEKGAFTGADGRKRGRFDLADGTTLFLDEIGEIPVELQAKLLRVLQEGEFERLGGTKTIRVDVRLVAATNRDLDIAVKEGRFRSDLFYRINTFPIILPALRDRGTDIDLLARHFAGIHSQRLGRDVHEISSEMMHQLRRYRWPGNIRELDGIIQRAMISNSGPVVELAEPLAASESEEQGIRIISSTIADLKLVERDHIVAVLDKTGWKISGANGAASQLGMPPSTLRSKMKKLGIVRPH